MQSSEPVGMPGPAHAPASVPPSGPQIWPWALGAFDTSLPAIPLPVLTHLPVLQLGGQLVQPAFPLDPALFPLDVSQTSSQRDGDSRETGRGITLDDLRKVRLDAVWFPLACDLKYCIPRRLFEGLPPQAYRGHGGVGSSDKQFQEALQEAQHREMATTEACQPE